MCREAVSPHDHFAWDHLVDFVTGAASADDAAAIRARIAIDPALRREVDDLRTAWSTRAPHGTWDHRTAWARVAARSAVAAKAPRTWHWMARVSAVAAAVLVLVGGILLRSLVSHHTSLAPAARDYATVPGQRATVVLPDGTRLVLGPDTRVRVSAGFAHPRREVGVEGEAYFEVTHDTRHPFVVRAANTVTEDLGTRFAVRAYPGDTGVRVVVAEGMVAVRALRPGADPRAVPASVLTRGSLAEVDGSGATRVTPGVDADALVAWRGGQLAFHDTPLRDVVTELARWYGADIRLGDATLGWRPVTVTFAGEPAGDAVDMVCGLVLARCERHEATITVRGLVRSVGPRDRRP